MLDDTIIEKNNEKEYIIKDIRKNNKLICSLKHLLKQ